MLNFNVIVLQVPQMFKFSFSFIRSKLMKLKTYRSRGLNPIPLIGLVLAWFVLTTSIADTDVSENPLPTLGTAESSDS